MHDTLKLLEKGIPASCICTEPFRGAATIHAGQLNWPHFAAVAIPHPLQPLGEDAVHQRADGLVPHVLRDILGTTKRGG